LKVLSFSDLTSIGGAAVAYNRIADSLRSKGNQLQTVTAEESHIPGAENSVLFQGKKIILLESLFSRVLPDQLLTKMKIKAWKRQFEILLKQHKPDIINFHNLHSAGLPFGLILTALKYGPVVWTLHDCWSFSSMYYPQFSPPPKGENLIEMKSFWSTTKNCSSKSRLSAITPSVWLRNLSTSSYWDGKLVEAIHNPVPDSFFEDRDQQACKKTLGLDLSKPTVLCVAGNLEEERKGGPVLNRVLASPFLDKAQMLLIGSGCFDSHDSSKVKSLGFVRDEVTLQIAYHAADLLLHLAPIDNLPNTVAESMSCGTPVLAFHTGGLPEMVIPGKSGWLVKEINAPSIIAQLDSVLISKDYQNLRESTKQYAHKLFSSEIIACKYMDHFQAALANV
jgi:glycosyltransferase involved in cell wall biosynthesis